MGERTRAVKKMDCDQKEIPREVTVHCNLPPHPTVVPLLGITHSKDGFTIYICMELGDKSLHHYLHTEKKKPSLQQSTKWAMQIARGMDHIHEHGLVHCDLKSANVLLFEKEDVTKICDFGSAQPLDHTSTVSGTAGTYRWMAPEFSKTNAQQRSDVFSYGMILYEIFAQKIPFSDVSDQVAVASKIRDGVRPPIPSELPLYIKVLIQTCWEQEAHYRPTFKGILRVGLLSTQYAADAMV